MSCLMNSVAQENGKYIEHEVSKLDTLAGVAIKYGVEVSDIKRMNGLATHLQMFAFKRLLIPLPARHAPSSPPLSHSSSSSTYNYDYNYENKRESSIDSNGLQQSQSLRLTSPKMVSPAMSILHKYYSLKCPTNNTEMAVGNPLLAKASPNHDLNLLPSSRNDIQPDTAIEAGNNEKSNENSVRRRQSLAMRPTPTCLTIHTQQIRSLNSISVVEGLVDDIFTNGVTTTTLQGQDNCGSPSVWTASKWNLTPELLAAAAMTGRKSKAALD